MNKYLELMNLIFEEKDMGFYHDRMYRSYLTNARNYAIKLEQSTIIKYVQLLLEGLIMIHLRYKLMLHSLTKSL